jgi:uncharacterized protein
VEQPLTDRDSTSAVRPEPVTAQAPRPAGRPLLNQDWREVVFLHWPAEPEQVARLLPPSVTPDIVDGTTYVGLIALRMCRVGPLGLPPVPYLGWFPEINVRVYSVGPDGRRGVVFLSLDAARLVPAVTGLAGLRLPYRWSRIRATRDGSTVSYTNSRRWPGPAGAHMRLKVQVGDPVASPSALEQFLTARWGLHVGWYRGHPLYVPNEHPRWPLHRATLRDLDENLISAVGLTVAGDPVSVLYAPGVRVRAGLPQRLPG